MSDAREIRPGEQVRMQMQHEDKDGRVMWDMASNWYGFDNANANEMTVGLLHAIGEYTRKLSGIKNS